MQKHLSHQDLFQILTLSGSRRRVALLGKPAVEPITPSSQVTYDLLNGIGVKQKVRRRLRVKQLRYHTFGGRGMDYEVVGPGFQVERASAVVLLVFADTVKPIIFPVRLVNQPVVVVEVFGDFRNVFRRKWIEGRRIAVVM